jgi:hypothetical protein
MALADANYKYLMIDVGAYRCNSDAGIFENCQLGKSWLQNCRCLSIPEDRPLLGSESNLKLPQVIIADEAFALKHNILCPFQGHTLTQQRIFNCHLSRARRVVENTFSITSHVWRILLKRMEVSVNFATLITVACCTLHNFLLSANPQPDLVRHYLQDQQHETDEEERGLNQNIIGKFPRLTTLAMEIRNAFADWFSSPAGALPFQNEII